MAGRLRESWSRPIASRICAPGSGLRQALSEQRSGWQQRIEAVLYHQRLENPRCLSST
jgi:hypothetical protein